MGLLLTVRNILGIKSHCPCEVSYHVLPLCGQVHHPMPCEDKILSIASNAWQILRSSEPSHQGDTAWFMIGSEICSYDSCWTTWLADERGTAAFGFSDGHGTGRRNFPVGDVSKIRWCDELLPQVDLCFRRLCLSRPCHWRYRREWGLFASR